MKTVKELREILQSVPFTAVDAHIHTHLCDGAPDMTVENIARSAEARGMQLIVLTPHFHKQVSDETATLYTDSDPAILVRLREEIEDYRGDLKILLSTELDILDIEGNTASHLSDAAIEALDLVTPTVNYHPLLPLDAVGLTMGRRIAGIYESGSFKRYTDAVGGVDRVLTALYEAERNALLRSPYPAMLGHFFAAHAYAVGRYSWFGAEERHLPLMKKGALGILDAAEKTGAMIDLTGIHCIEHTPAEKTLHDGFFFEFQKWFVKECREHGVLAFPGTDSHGQDGIGEIEYYRYLI